MGTISNNPGLILRIAQQPPWLQQELVITPVNLEPLGKEGDLNMETIPQYFI